MAKTMTSEQSVTYVTVEIEVEVIYYKEGNGLVIDKIDYHIPEHELLNAAWESYYENQ